jgi:hypothetical protein
MGSILASIDRFSETGSHKGVTPLRTATRIYRMDRRDISYLRFILEAYEGMAVLTTREAALGIVSITIAPGSETLVDNVLAALVDAGEIHIEPFGTEDRLGDRPECGCTSSS